MLNEYTLLRYNAIPRISRNQNQVFSILVSLEENQPTIFLKRVRAITSKEESDEVICGKIYQIGFTTVVLQLC